MRTGIGFEGVASLECSASKKLPGRLREHYEIGLAGIARHLVGED